MTLPHQRDAEAGGRAQNRVHLAAAERIARGGGCDTVEIAFITGNTPAQDFYVAYGYSFGERVPLSPSLGSVTRPNPQRHSTEPDRPRRG